MLHKLSLAHQILTQMDNTYLAFYLGRKEENPTSSFLDAITCSLTNSRYSHVELVVGYNEENHSGLCFSSSRRDKGVRAKNISFKKHWELYEIKTKFSHDEIENWFSEQYGKKYDYFGALGVRFSIFKHDPKRWFCSEIIAACLGIENHHRFSPQGLYDFLVDKK